MNFLKSFTCAVAALLLATGAAAQTFGSEVRVSTINGPSIFPQVTSANGTNNIYVTWQENFDQGGGVFDGEIYFRRSTTNGSGWDAPINLSNNSGRQDLLPIVAASGTTVAVFWTNDFVNGDIFYAYSTNSGASFSAPAQITNTAGYSRPSGALVDANGRIHLVYYDNTANGQSYGEVYHMCSTSPGAAFTAPVNVLTNDGVVDNESPRLVQTSDNVIHLMYRTSRNGMPQGGWPPFDTYILRTNSAVNSCTISNTQTGSPPLFWMFPAQKVSKGLPEELVNSYGAQVVRGNGGATLHAAWWNDRAGSNLIYRKGDPNGIGWLGPVDVSRLGVGHLQWDGTAVDHGSFGLGEDVAGNVHFVFGDRTSTIDGYLTGNLYYTCINNAGVIQSKVSAKVTGAANSMMPKGIVNNGVMHMVWADFRDAQAATTTGAEIYYRGVTVGACSIAAAPQAGLSSSLLAFGGQSMGTTSPAQQVTITNIGTGTLTINGITPSAQFAQTNDCGSLAAGASCTVNVTFTPTPTGVALNGTSNVNGTLTIASNGSGSPNQVTLTGTGEKSLITHYYRSILRRAPDGGGKAYWQGEAARLVSKTVNVNEAWYAMAQFFFFSSEYVALGRDNTGFITDLYTTFFNRAPDGGGLAYWVGQLNSGLPREVALAGFMFSPEFTTFAQGIFGNTAARAEVDVVGDFYRGLLSRVPDDSGIDYWVAQFRAAQCSGQTAVYGQVEAISSSFATGGEYLARGRTNAQYVGDLYNAFLRRGGDLAGVQYWINELNTAARTREQVRQAFISTPEFTNRVNAIVAQGCIN